MKREIKNINDKFIFSVYCGPQPPFKINDKTYPDRITEEQFKLLQDMGINLIYGQCDIMNTATEKYAFRAMEICDKLGLGYLVKDQISREYCSLGTPAFRCFNEMYQNPQETLNEFPLYQYKDYRMLSDKEKIELDEKFRTSIKRYAQYQSFKGIIFIDEPGVEMFDAISRAFSIFNEEYPDKLFLVNHLPYYAFESQLQFGFHNALAKTEPIKEELQFNIDKNSQNYDGFYIHNYISRFEYFISEFFKKVNCDVFSYDAYPFFDHFGNNTLVHKVIYEMPEMAHVISKNYNVKFWIFLQCGGLWDKATKVTTFADVQLSVSLAMAFGAKGLQLFTGCFSNDCLPRKSEISGVLDEYGNVTNQYDFYRYAFRQAKAIEKYIVPATIEAIIMRGEYYDRTPDVETLKLLEVTDIYKGQLPPYANLEAECHGDLKNIESDYQSLTSCFNYKGKQIYLVVNTSPVVATTVTLTFSKQHNLLIIQSGYESCVITDTYKIRNLPAGENCLIIVD